MTNYLQGRVNLFNAEGFKVSPNTDFRWRIFNDEGELVTPWTAASDTGWLEIDTATPFGNEVDTLNGGAVVRVRGRDAPPIASDALVAAIEAGIAAGKKIDISLADYGIDGVGWKLTLTPPPAAGRTALEIVADAIDMVDAIAVVDPGDTTPQLDLPVAVVQYDGHDRPTGSSMKQRVLVNVLGVFLPEADAHEFLADLARQLISVLEALPTFRLLEVSSPIELESVVDPAVTVLGFQLTLQEA